MAQAVQVERSPLVPGPGAPLTPPDRTAAGRAQAFFVTGLAWGVVVIISWLAWWLLGPQGREAVAGTVGLSAAQLAPYVLAALVTEKLAVKGLLFAALYHWLRARSARGEAGA